MRCIWAMSLGVVHLSSHNSASLANKQIDKTSQVVKCNDQTVKAVRSPSIISKYPLSVVYTYHSDTGHLLYHCTHSDTQCCIHLPFWHRSPAISLHPPWYSMLYTLTILTQISSYIIGTPTHSTATFEPGIVLYTGASILTGIISTWFRTWKKHGLICVVDVINSKTTLLSFWW